MVFRSVIKSLFSKPATAEYPKAKDDTPATLRGKFTLDDNKCIRCLSCVKVCPTNACTFDPKATPANGKKGKIGIDFGKCCFCYQCVTVCPTKAYAQSNEFEMASSDKKKFVMKD